MYNNITAIVNDTNNECFIYTLPFTVELRTKINVFTYHIHFGGITVTNISFCGHSITVM